MNVSVIIPVYNGERTLRECLSAVVLEADRAGETEILVVDNGSTDATREIAGSFGSVLLVDEFHQKGAYAARNTGVQAAKGDVLVFTDADCIPTEGWLRRLTEDLATSRCDFMGGPIFSAHPVSYAEEFLRDVRIVSQERAFLGDFFRLPFLVTANVAYKRTVFEQVGEFDRELWISGDADFSWRARDAGFKIGYTPRAPVLHKHRATTRQLYSQFYQYGYGWVELLRKHRHRFDRISWKFDCAVDLAERELKIILRNWRSLSRREKILRFLGVLSSVGHMAGCRDACKKFGIAPEFTGLPLLPKANQLMGPGIQWMENPTIADAIAFYEKLSEDY